MNSYKQSGPHPAMIFGVVQLLLGIGSAYMGFNSSDTINHYGFLLMGVLVGTTGISNILKGRSAKMPEFVISEEGIQVLNYITNPEYENVLPWSEIGRASLRFPKDAVKNIYSLNLYYKAPKSGIARQIENFNQYAAHREALEIISAKIDQPIEGITQIPNEIKT